MRAYTFFVCCFAFIVTGCIGSGSISSIESQGQAHFPILTGIDLLGNTRKIPQTLSGQLNIVVVAFEREQQVDVDTWIMSVTDILQSYDSVGFYEIPLIYEVNAAYRAWINNGMRSGIEDAVSRERTITVYTDREQFIGLMNMSTNDIYVLLLDRQGKILWRTQGIATTENTVFLENAIRQYISHERS